MSTKIDRQKILNALSDSDSPLYGSDLVPLFEELLEQYDIMVNRVLDMQLAIVGWREKLSYNSEDDLISDLERMMEKAVPNEKPRS